MLLNTKTCKFCETRCIKLQNKFIGSQYLLKTFVVFNFNKKYSLCVYRLKINLFLTFGMAQTSSCTFLRYRDESKKE